MAAFAEVLLLFPLLAGTTTDRGGEMTSGHFFWLQRVQQVLERDAGPWIVCR